MGDVMRIPSTFATLMSRVPRGHRVIIGKHITCGGYFARIVTDGSGLIGDWDAAGHHWTPEKALNEALDMYETGRKSRFFQHDFLIRSDVLTQD